MTVNSKSNLAFWKIYLTGLFSGIVICIGIWGLVK